MTLSYTVSPERCTARCRTNLRSFST